MTNSQLQAKPQAQAQAGETGRAVREREVQAQLPAVDVIEDAAGITLLADLPGVPRDKLSLQVDAESLTIEGEVVLDVPEGMQSNHVELRVPRFRRSFTLSKELDSEKVAAELKNGVLRLRIPKAQHAQPRKIEVRVS
ncbi:MAG: Hsp20/alpha crystallin family protein [Paucimonas sp.]|nr:Hsp20/alpha crystallin family protein [Paucimonas sp.]